MANETSQDSGKAQSDLGQTRKQDPAAGSQPAGKRTNPFGEPEPPGNEETRRAPGSEQEYQGGASQEKRAPGIEEDTTVDDNPDKRKSA